MAGPVVYVRVPVAPVASKRLDPKFEPDSTPCALPQQLLGLPFSTRSGTRLFHWLLALQRTAKLRRVLHALHNLCCPRVTLVPVRVQLMICAPTSWLVKTVVLGKDISLNHLQRTSSSSPPSKTSGSTKQAHPQVRQLLVRMWTPPHLPPLLPLKGASTSGGFKAFSGTGERDAGVRSQAYQMIHPLVSFLPIRFRPHRPSTRRFLKSINKCV